jgi:Tripartite tricarboxylate transporter TctB family
MSDPAPPGGIRSVRVEAVVALLVLLFGAVTAWQSWQLGARWTSDGPGAGYFPFYIALVMCAASAAILAGAARRMRSDLEVFVDGERLRRVMQVLLPMLLYIAAVQLLGIYLASAAYIALFMVLLGGYGWLRSLVVGTAASALFCLMFEVWFKVPLFKGALDPTRFLGY